MDKLPFRQINLDFHTSECMPDVGSRFSEDDFEWAIKTGHISSITLFAKCHHGWSYFPSKVNPQHPTLSTDLLDRQLSVCERLGVRAQIYISAGLDERKANLYPQFCVSVPNSDNTLLGAHWHGLCLNNDDYLDMLENEVSEIMQTFAGRFDGLFVDICTPAHCVCASCIESMLALGLDPEKYDDVESHRKVVYKKFTDRINSTVARFDKDMAVFFNCGNIPRNDRETVYSNTKHLELESLPTGGWGYDHFPLSAAYARVLGKEFLGMTGKFHKAWGEFGGYKHPNALIYETSLCLANGAKCSVGDQLHPLGKFDRSTYELIGKAYALVEKKEPWCGDVTAVADIAIFSAYTEQNRGKCPDVGANRILLEGHYLYNIIDSECDFSDYKVIIFPDSVTFDSRLANKVKTYIADGGKILITGKSGLIESGEFFDDFGVKYLGENPIDNTYMVPNYDMYPNGKAAYHMYNHGYLIETDGTQEVIAYMQNAYFNRTFRHFCSHSVTPNDPGDFRVGALISDNIGYIAWNIFSEYADQGAYHHKQLVCDVLDRLLGEEKSLTTNLQSGGVVTLMFQPHKNRYINHLLYCVPKLRGSVEVVEDAPVTVNTTVNIKVPSKPKRVYTAPDGRGIPFVCRNNILSYTVDSFCLHGMVVIEF